MTPPIKKGRASVEKQHYWLQIDFDVRADSLSDALDRAAKMFRRAYRQRIRDFGLVYMGAHSATVRGDLKAPRTMHPTVVLKKGLPIEEGVSLATLDAEQAERDAARAAKKAKKEFTLVGTTCVASMSIPGDPLAPVGKLVGTMEPDGKTVTFKVKPKKKSGGGVLSGLMLQ